MQSCCCVFCSGEGGVEVIQNSTKTASYCDKANSCLVNSYMWDLVFRLTYLRYTTRHLPVVRGVFVRSDVSASPHKLLLTRTNSCLKCLADKSCLNVTNYAISHTVFETACCGLPRSQAQGRSWWHEPANDSLEARLCGRLRSHSLFHISMYSALNLYISNRG